MAKRKPHRMLRGGGSSSKGRRHKSQFKVPIRVLGLFWTAFKRTLWKWFRNLGLKAQFIVLVCTTVGFLLNGVATSASFWVYAVVGMMIATKTIGAVRSK